MYDCQQVMIVFSINLDKHVISTRSVVTLNHLRNLFKLGYNIIKRTWIFQEETYVSTSLIAHFLRVELIVSTLYHSHLCQFRNALMNSGTRYITRPCHFEERYSRIISNHLKDLLIQCI